MEINTNRLVWVDMSTLHWEGCTPNGDVTAHVRQMAGDWYWEVSIWQIDQYDMLAHGGERCADLADGQEKVREWLALNL